MRTGSKGSLRFLRANSTFRKKFSPSSGSANPFTSQKAAGVMDEGIELYRLSLYPEHLTGLVPKRKTLCREGSQAGELFHDGAHRLFEPQPEAPAEASEAHL